MHNIFYLGLSGEHRCPLGYLFHLGLHGIFKKRNTCLPSNEENDSKCGLCDFKIYVVTTHAVVNFPCNISIFFLLFQNFLIRKGFKNNLKRTKSATKLDRKRAASQAVDSDG